MSEDADLIKELEERISYPKVGKVSKAEHDIWGFPPEVRILRWKFNEWDYYSDKAHLPTNARGLFTIGDRILLRGYNKFFNTGETKATKPENLASDTIGPYYATVKENGFLVMIGSLHNKLVVTSKNSSGPGSTNDSGGNHSRVAREWVLRQLEQAGQSEEALATLLEENNWTAVGEVCDDSFEEHVLSYPGQAAGIYLNGLNQNQRHFATESPAKVAEVAKKFGFKVTDYVEFASLGELQQFLETSSLTGKWQNRDVEGFVIRCKRTSKTGEIVDFFWKYKFEEPYFMYREWREVVKTYLTKSINAAYMKAKQSKHSESSLRFLQFAVSYITEHPALKEQIVKHSRGVFEIRDQLYLNSSDLNEQKLLELDLNTPKYLLVTVATIGCGKSTVSQALTHLMHDRWGHKQSDNVTSRKGNKFGNLMDMILEDLSKYDVAILDRNNSMISERAKFFELLDDMSVPMGYDTKAICLNFLPDGVDAESRKITRKRVIDRGDNHQNISVSAMGVRGVEGIMANFEKRFQPVNSRVEPDSRFDLVIDLEPGNSVANVAKILDVLRSQSWPKLTVPEFSLKDIETAVNYSLDTKVTSNQPIKKYTGKATGDKKKRAKYFGLLVDPQSHDLLLRTAKALDAPLDTINVQSRFHVTLAHVSSHKQEFDQLSSRHKVELSKANSFPKMLGVKSIITVTALAWSKAVIAFRAEAEGCANKYGHITVGTVTGVPPVAARELFEPGANATVVQLPEPLILQNQELFASP